MNPIKKAIALIDDTLNEIEMASQTDIRIDQRLDLKSFGAGKISQGNITINITNQKIMLNLFRIRETIKAISDGKVVVNLDRLKPMKLNLRKIQELVAREYVRDVLLENNGDYNKTAEELGISRSTAFKYMKEIENEVKRIK